MFDSLLKKGWCYTSSDKNILKKILLILLVLRGSIFWFLMRKALQQQYKITFILYINQFLVLKSFSFLFLQTFWSIISLSFSLCLSLSVFWHVWVLNVLLLLWVNTKQYAPKWHKVFRVFIDRKTRWSKQTVLFHAAINNN